MNNISFFLSLSMTVKSVTENCQRVHKILQNILSPICTNKIRIDNPFSWSVTFAQFAQFYLHTESLHIK